MNKLGRVPTLLASLIVILAAVAAGVGVFWHGEGEPFEFQTLRGEIVTIQGSGLYRYDTVSLVAQAVGQDVVTLIVAIPLLIVSAIGSRRGSLRGRLLLAGVLGYFLYTYITYVFLVAYNVLFLVYVGLFSLSLFALILTLFGMDVAALPGRFTRALPRRTISIFLLVLGSFLLLMWLGTILPPLMAGQPPAELESYTSLGIQALDLAVVVPLAFLAAVQLWQKKSWGYLLASVVLIKVAALALAVSAMAVNQIRVGVPRAAGQLVIFAVMAAISTALTILLLRHVVDTGGQK